MKGHTGHSGALQLSEYKWSLKNREGELLATQHFMVSSQGEAVMDHSSKLGRYMLMKHIVMYNGIPVFRVRHDDKNY